MKDQRKKIDGIGIFEDIGFGKAFVVRSPEIDFEKKSRITPEEEKSRFNSAMSKLCDELQQMIESSSRSSGGDEADILEAQLILARDSSITEQSLNRIEKGYTAEASVKEVCEKCIDSFNRSGDSTLIAKTEDIRDIMRRMFVILVEKDDKDVFEMPEGSILVCEELDSFMITRLFRSKVAGIVTQRGGSSGHAAVVARSLMIPTVFSAGSVMRLVEEGEELIVDGENGEVYISPNADDAALCRKVKQDLDKRRELVERFNSLPGTTKDGEHFAVLSNVGSLDEVDIAVKHGCEGIGLFRTEFLFQQNLSEPSEEEQLNIYRKAILKMPDESVMIRTFDLGGDKRLPYQINTARSRGGQEKNPNLGLRGIRFSLVEKEMFKTQVKAAMCAAIYGKVYLGLPMVTNLSELREAKKLIREAVWELDREGRDFDRSVQVGVMIETPSAAMMSHEFAREADFFAVGTNDLTQYVMSAERGNPQVEYLLSVFEPAVIRASCRVINAAKEAGIKVGFCGEAASDPRFLALLIAWGADGVSVIPSKATQVKAQIARYKKKGMDEFFAPVLEMATREEILDFLDGALKDDICD